MTKIRFILNIVLILLFTVAAIILSGNTLWLYVDIASLILAIAVPFLVISMIFPLSDQRRYCNAILSKSNDDKVVLMKAVEYLKSYKTILIYSAVIWTIMGAVGIGAHLEGPEVLGLNFGVLMIVPFYTVIFLLSVIEPLKATAQNKVL